MVSQYAGAPHSSTHPKREGLGRCSQGAFAEGALLPRLLPRGDSTLPDLPLPLGENSLPGGAELLCCPCATARDVMSDYIFYSSCPPNRAS